MPPKRKPVRRVAKPKIVLVPVQRGSGLFGSLVRGIGSTARGSMNIMNQLGVKPSQVIGLIPHSAAKTTSGLLSQLGLGKRRVGRPRKRRTTRR